MNRNLFKNYLFYILYQVLTILTPIIVVPYTTRVIGATGLGINAFTSSIVQWFVIFGIMGISMYGNKEIARVRDDRELLSKTFMGIFIMQLINMLVVSVLYIAFVYFAKVDNKIIYFLQGFVLLATMFDITWFFLGVEDFKKSSIRNMVFKLINVALIFIFVKDATDLPIFVFINTFTQLLGQLVLFVQLNEYIDFKWVSIRDAFALHMRPNFVLFVPQIAISIYSVLDQTMTGLLSVDEAQLAFYQQAIRFDKMFLYFITSIGMVMLPRIANEHAKGDKGNIFHYLNTTLKLALYLAIPMMFGMIGVGPFFINWFLAPEFTLVGYLIALMSPIIVFISLSNVFGIQFMVPTNMLRQYSLSVIFGAVTNFILNLILIPMYGAIGSAISVMSAELVVTITQFFYVRKHFRTDLQWRSVITYIVAGSIMCVSVYFVGLQMGSRLLTNLVQAAMGAIIYLGILTVSREPFHINLLNKLKGQLPWLK